MFPRENQKLTVEKNDTLWYSHAVLVFAKRVRSMNLFSFFSAHFGVDPQGAFFAPYRLCPLGAHTDHNLGLVTGFAIDKGVRFAFCKEGRGVVEAVSAQFPAAARWSVHQTPAVKQGDWADYLRGATLELHKRYPLDCGIKVAIQGEMPIGGLSSSAAVTLGFLGCLCSVNRISLTDEELVELAYTAERNYVGVACGKLDQSCEVYGKKDHLLFVDMLDGARETIAQPAAMKPYEMAVLFSGVERSLVGSRYNMRVDEAKSAAYALKAFAGFEYGKFDQTVLRDVPVEVFEAYRNRLPDPWRRRAEHWYGECDRVRQGVQAWREGDLERFGALVFESGRSSIELWQTGSPELIRLYELMTQTDGVYGGRFSGAGFKGCCLALLDPNKADTALEEIRRQYLHTYPTLADRYTACLCQTADGIGTEEKHEND